MRAGCVVLRVVDFKFWIVVSAADPLLSHSPTLGWATRVSKAAVAVGLINVTLLSKVRLEIASADRVVDEREKMRSISSAIALSVVDTRGPMILISMSACFVSFGLMILRKLS